MGKKKTAIGICSLCGKQRPLSFEHVPPKAAFNRYTTLSYDPLAWLERGQPNGTRIEQGGIGRYSLCQQCNSNTGHWYGNEYAKWANIVYPLLIKSREKLVEIVLHDVYPLRFFKQVISCFCSRNGPKFVKIHPKVQKYLLDKNSCDFDDSLTVLMYLNKQGFIIATGISGYIENGRNYIVSEFNFPPFGFCLYAGHCKYDSRVDITFFSDYEYDENDDIAIKVPVLEKNNFLPDSYRP